MNTLIILILIFMTILLIQEIRTLKVYAQELVTPSGIKIEDLEDKVDEFMRDNLSKQAPGASRLVNSKFYGQGHRWRFINLQF